MERISFFSDEVPEPLRKTFKLLFDILVFDEQSDATICRGDGRIIAMGQSAKQSEKINGRNWVGMTVYDLERKNIYSPSAAAIALKEKRRITIVHRNPFGKDVVSTSVPIFHENSDQVQYVISFEAINIDDEESLNAQFSDLKRTISQYRERIHALESEKKKKMELIAFSKAMTEVRQLCDHIGRIDANILITGESGVGKNVVARYIHENSSRESGPFVEINCGAIPESLIESELFGYEKGAFTGASAKGKKGLIEMAHKGTLFLDEIGELPSTIQTKLLRVIQQKKIVKVGGTQDIEVDFRLVTATNKDLLKMIEEHSFREDLYYRLNVVPIHVKSLRERKEDIIPLAKHFLSLYNLKYGENKLFTREILEKIYEYGWPGNVRELENFIERMVVTSLEQELRIDTLTETLAEMLCGTWNGTLAGPLTVNRFPERESHPSDPQYSSPERSMRARRRKELVPDEIKTLKEQMQVQERRIIVEAYERYGTSVNVGLALGIGQTTAAQKIKKYVRRWDSED